MSDDAPAGERLPPEEKAAEAAGADGAAEGPIHCPFCSTAFDAPEAWCPHFIGIQADLTLDDYHDFISGEYSAKTIADADGEAYYFIVRN